MRVFSPYANLATMSGLALGAGEDDRRFVPPQFVPNPKASDADAKEFLKIWTAWATAREFTIGRWANDIDELIKLEAATCEQIEQYNDAALRHWAEEAVMGHRLIEAGADIGNVPMPLLPAIFASAMKFEDTKEGFRILRKLPCKKDRFGRLISPYPDYSKLRIFGEPDQVEGAFTKSGALGALPAIGWAAVVLGGLIVAGFAFSVRSWRNGLTLVDSNRLRVETLKTETEDNANRAELYLACVASSLEALGRELTPSEMQAIRDDCAQKVLKIAPPRKGQEITDSTFGKNILLGGLGVAVAVSAFAYLRSRQHRE